MSHSPQSDLETNYLGEVPGVQGEGSLEQPSRAAQSSLAEKPSRAAWQSNLAEQPRAAKSSPEQPRAAQGSPKQPRAAQSSSGAVHTKAAQSSPEPRSSPGSTQRHQRQPNLNFRFVFLPELVNVHRHIAKGSTPICSQLQGNGSKNNGSDLVAILGLFGDPFRPSWGHLGRSWDQPRIILGRLWAILGCLGAHLGAFWGYVSPASPILGFLGTYVGTLLDNLWPCWAILGPS